MFYNWWNALKARIVHEVDTTILFGYPENDKHTKALNYILLIAKYHIYAQKQNKSAPFLPLMLMQLKNQLVID